MYATNFHTHTKLEAKIFVMATLILVWLNLQYDRLCGLVVRRYQIFWVVVGLERGPLSLVSLLRSIEELLDEKKK
jgi:hypothetical protein